ncbi:MAG: hypothetical protein GXY55_09970 [Phycisphaerae bacterium]|nr:hypothetical protein [Phycisphaerae bacterium]
MRRSSRPAQEAWRTYDKSHAVRLPDHDYAADVPTHLTICAEYVVTDDPAFAQVICGNVDFYGCRLRYDLFCYCLMPDHLHVLLSPGASGIPIAKWLDSFKSFTTHEFMKTGGHAPLWQRSANDHVCRASETVENVARYIVNSPVRAGLVEKWDDWPWTKVFVEI